MPNKFVVWVGALFCQPWLVMLTLGALHSFYHGVPAVGYLAMLLVYVLVYFTITFGTIVAVYQRDWMRGENQ